MSAPQHHLLRLGQLVELQLDGAAHPSAVDHLSAVCRVALANLEASGAEVLLVDDAGVTGMVAGAWGPGGRGEDLQLGLGEGPAVLAASSGCAVAVPRLDAAAVARWPAWAPSAGALGTAAAFAFPLRVGAALPGVLDIRRGTPGDLSPGQSEDALALADLAVGVLLSGQGRAGPDRTPPDVDDALQHHTVVHQAQGMLAVQLGVDLGTALARMRARSFSEGRSLVAVARDVVARKLRFEPDAPDEELHDGRHR